MINAAAGRRCRFPVFADFIKVERHHLAELGFRFHDRIASGDTARKFQPLGLVVGPSVFDEDGVSNSSTF